MKRNSTFLRSLNHLWITWFGCGLVPLAPGTAGSLGALPLCWVLQTILPSKGLVILLTMGITLLACLGAAWDQRTSKKRDPGYIVIDEVAGMLWSTLWIPRTGLWYFVAFVLFRIFDVLKPFPANYFDLRSKQWHDPYALGTAIVLDDVIAGFYVALVLQGLLFYWGSFSTSPIIGLTIAI